MTFVNPYTFIRFPEKVIRKEPLGHAPTREQALKRYTGRLEVTWTLKSPLAIPNDGSWGLVDEHDTEVRIPGASVKGAVRSLHEALFAGCARVMDPMFTPVYREPIVPNMEAGWSLALVVSPDAEVAPRRADANFTEPAVEVLLCQPNAEWVRAQGVLDKANGLPKTGDFIQIDRTSSDPGRFRKAQWAKVDSMLQVPREGGWNRDCRDVTDCALRDRFSVVLATDTAARSGVKSGGVVYEGDPSMRG